MQKEIKSNLTSKNLVNTLILKLWSMEMSNKYFWRFNFLIQMVIAARSRKMDLNLLEKQHVNRSDGHLLSFTGTTVGGKMLDILHKKYI